MVWLLGKFENGRARKFENEMLSKCSFYKWVAPRHWSSNVVTLTRCRDDVVVMSQHHSDFLIGFT